MDYKKFFRHSKNNIDLLPLFGSYKAYKVAIRELASKFDNIHIEKVIAVEGYGFVIGGSLSYELGVGFVPLRRTPYSLENSSEKAYIDPAGEEKKLYLAQDTVSPGESVLLVDYKVVTGLTIKAAIDLVKQSGASIEGVGVLFDSSNSLLKEFLNIYNYKFLVKV